MEAVQEITNELRLLAGAFPEKSEMGEYFNQLADRIDKAHLTAIKNWLEVGVKKGTEKAHPNGERLLRSVEAVNTWAGCALAHGAPYGNDYAQCLRDIFKESGMALKAEGWKEDAH